MLRWFPSIQIEYCKYKFSEVIPKLILQRKGSYVKAHCLFSRANCGGQRRALNGQVYALTHMKYYWLGRK